MKYLTSKQHLQRLRFERFKTWLKYIFISVMGALAIGIVYICLTSENDTKKMNNCLKNNNLDYCNKEVK